jgi:hypothetical protein
MESSTYQAWLKRIEDAKAIRDAEDEHVWKPLFDALCGSLLQHSEGRAEATNGMAQFEDVIFPLLVGDDRQAVVRPLRAGPGEDFSAKAEFANYMADVATGIARAIGCYQDQYGRPGELLKCFSSALWSVGVLVFGFEPPRAAEPPEERDRGIEGSGDQEQPAGPTAPPPTEQREEDKLFPEVDEDLAVAENNELSDAGMPWCRHYSAREVVFDGQFKDIHKGRFAAVEMYLTLQQCKKRWPELEAKWKKTSEAAPGEGDDAKAGGDGIVGFWHVYAVDPLRELIVPMREAGVTEVLDERPLELGIEGLPILVLGGKWRDRRLYPEPLAARVFGAAQAEIEAVETQRSALDKMKTGLLTRDTKLAGLLRKGDDNGVYYTDTVGDLKDVLLPIEIGAMRREHLDAEELARTRMERNGGIADLQLGRREPGNPTATETAARQQAITARLSGLLKPARLCEANMFRRLAAIVMSKPDLMSGMQFPLSGNRLAAIDANRPMIGEMFDYEFDVKVKDRITDADIGNAAQTLAQSMVGIEQQLAARGFGVHWERIATHMAATSGLPDSDELVMPLPPPPPQPAMEGGAVPPDLAADPGAAPMQEAAPPPPAPPTIEELYTALDQVPEGDPAEDEILAQIAQLQAA